MKFAFLHYNLVLLHRYLHLQMLLYLQACKDWTGSPNRPSKSWILVLVQQISRPRSFTSLLNAPRAASRDSRDSDRTATSSAMSSWYCSLAPQWLWRVALSLSNPCMLKSVGARKQPCLTSKLTGKFDKPQPHFTALSPSVYRLSIKPIIHVKISPTLRISHSDSQYTESNTFPDILRSMMPRLLLQS